VPKFVFTLQAVLRQRTVVEEQRQRELATLERERLRLQAAIADAQTRAVAEQDEVRRCLAAGDIAGAAAQRAAITRIKAEESRLRQSLVAHEPKLAAARQALLEAARDRKSMELLRDQRYAMWRAELNQREQAALDELATMRHGRDALPSDASTGAAA
jgi:flagellar protein FliJ